MTVFTLPLTPTCTYVTLRQCFTVGWRAVANHGAQFIVMAALCLYVIAAQAGLAVNVEITGISGALLNNVRAYLSIEQQKNDPQLNQNQLQRLHHRAEGEIIKALQPFGYYQPKIKSKLTFSDGKWLAHYDIDPGPPVHVNTVNIQVEGDGADDPELKSLVAAFPLHRGDVLNQPLYENGKQNFQRFASEHGYFDFKWLKNIIAVDMQTNTADITLIADSGHRYRFGKVIFHQDMLRSELLVRFIPFKEGDPYSTTKLLELQSALTDSDYFSVVDINPRRDLSKDLEVPIDVSLLPRPQHRYTIGAGYGTDTGARGKLGWENRRINDRGHRFSTEYNISQIHEGLTARYIIPIRNPRTDQFAITSSYSNDYPENSRSESFLLGVSRSIDRGKNWLETVYLNYQTESYSVGDDTGDSVMVMPGITWSKVIADNRIYPSRGLRLSLDVRGAHTGLISNVQFIQVRGQAKFIHKLFAKDRIILRGDVGATTFGAIRTLPTSVRFFTGGDQTVRGYAYNSLGPRDASGNVVGGSQLLVGSVEFEHRFTDKWSVVIFSDVGNAINSWQESLKRGSGFGIHWRSPVGPIRFDLGFAVSEPGSPKRLHINVGPDL
jgi:translocation and assembly module TamA